MLLKYIIENPVFDIDLNIRNNQGKTPLHAACVAGQNEAFKLLLKEGKGVDVNALSQNGWHVMHFVCAKGNLELLKYMVGNSSFHMDFSVKTEGGN